MKGDGGCGIIVDSTKVRVCLAMRKRLTYSVMPAVSAPAKSNARAISKGGEMLAVAGRR